LKQQAKCELNISVTGLSHQQENKKDNLSGKFPSKQLLPFLPRPLDEALIRTGLCALFRTRLRRKTGSVSLVDPMVATEYLTSSFRRPLTALIAVRAEREVERGVGNENYCSLTLKVGHLYTSSPMATRGTPLSTSSCSPLTPI